MKRQATFRNAITPDMHAVQPAKVTALVDLGATVVNSPAEAVLVLGLVLSASLLVVRGASCVAGTLIGRGGAHVRRPAAAQD